MKKNNISQFSNFQSLITKKISSPLKTISLSSQKLLDTYKVKNFEYISYKDFKNMLYTLEQMNKQIQRCYQSAQALSGIDQVNINEESCNINEVIGGILNLLKISFSNFKIIPQVRLASNLPLVKLNSLDGHQVILNILTNSMNAMPAGGKIKIRTEFKEKLKQVFIEISDEGVGISQQRLSKIFEPFVTTKEQDVEKSSGLGLSIVYGIVHGCGGTINIHSSLRKGTQVKILLPVI